MDAGQQRLGQVGDGLPPEPPADERGNRLVARGVARPGMRSSAAIRALPASEKSRVAASAETLRGMPSTELSGSGCSVPPRRMNDRRSSLVGKRRSPRPSSRHSSIAAGFWINSASGPASNVKPSTCSLRITPPRRGAASKRWKLAPRRCNS
jgi:hypothetical protein